MEGLINQLMDGWNLDELMEAWWMNVWILK
jgi:hypothetical protein